MGKVYVEDEWQFNPNPGGLSLIAYAWKNAASRLRSVASQHQSANSDIGTPTWDDRYATSYRQYVDSPRAAMTDTADLCDAVAKQLGDITDNLSNTKIRLTGSWWKVTAYPYTESEGVLVFTTPDGDEHIVRDECATARQIRADANDALTTSLNNLRAIDISAAQPWATVATTGNTAWDSPSPTQLQPIVRIDSFGNSANVSCTSDDEEITVSVDPTTGEIVITVMSILPLMCTPQRTYRFPAGTNVTINAGAGNDRIIVNPGTHVHLRVLGGAGNDTINAQGNDVDGQYFGGMDDDHIEAGSGRDYLSGGQGRDYLDGSFGNDRMFGGEGMDTLYGLDGDDTLDGGRDKDYLDGSAGQDVVFGGEGDDNVIGGRGDDSLFGGDGDDFLSTGDGTDIVWGDAGTDTVQAGIDDTSHADTTIIVEFDPSLCSFIEVTGSPEFIARVQSDLDFMRSDTEGQHLLQQIENDYNDPNLPGHEIGLTIEESQDDNGYARRGSNGEQGNTPNIVQYNPTFSLDWVGTYVPPFVVLYHELGHVYQYGSGTGATGSYSSIDIDGFSGTYPYGMSNLEPQDVGLVWDRNSDGAIDSKDEALSDETGHDPATTENHIREHLGYEPRPIY